MALRGIDRRSQHGAWKMLLALAVLTGLAGAADTTAAETPLERGRYLVNTILACGNCHSPRGPGGAFVADKELSGGILFDTPAFVATASNITPDRETGIGTWSEAEVKRALTEGVRPNHARLPGTPLAAIMPVNFYKALLPRDLDAIVAYLATVKPVRNEVPDPIYKLPVRHDHYPDAEGGFTEDGLRDPVRRGAYLATIGHCMECHTPMVKGATDYKNAMGKGGREFSLPPPGGSGAPLVSVSPNITSHPKAGIGAWTDAEIKRAITHGVSRDGRKLKPPMAYSSYADMTDEDVNAIVAWLRTVPPLE